MSEYRVRFHYSASTARRVYWSLLWARQAVFIVASPFILAWALVSLRSPDYAPLAGFVVGVVTVFWASWLGGIRQTGRVATALGDPEVEMIATDETVTFRTPLAESVVRWAGIANLYRLPRYWVVFRRGLVNPSFFPVETLELEGREFVEKQIRHAGGRVR
jgi:hypothetical protein